MISDTNSEKDLRTELVLNFHSDCNVFPFRSTTSSPVTSSRLGDSSPCPTLSTRLRESDLGGQSVLVERINDGGTNVRSVEAGAYS